MTSTFDLVGTLRLVRRAGGTRSAFMSRIFPATVEQIWRACTEPESLARWIGRLDGDPTSGKARLIMGSTGQVIVDLSILRCEPPHWLELVWGFPGEDESVVRATVRAVDGGTELAIEHFALTTRGGILYGAGWEEFMADLGDHLAGRERDHDCAELEERTGAIWADLPDEPDDRWGGFDAATYRLARDFAVPPAQLWAAVATPSGLDGWFGAFGGAADGWTIAFDGGGVHGTVESCDEGTAYTTTFVQDIDPVAVHRIQVTVEEIDGGSRLTLVHHYAPGSTPNLRRGMAAGWWAHTSSLAHTLGGSPADWAADFQIAGLVLRPGSDASSEQPASA
jgi:uncharacterized protein YndB with AHSA1/START domain